MHAAWPVESAERYTVLDPGCERGVLVEDIAMARKKGWDQIMPLYGVDSEYSPTICDIPTTYALPKAKMYDT